MVNKLLFKYFLFFFLSVFISCACASQTVTKDSANEAYEIGAMVQNIQVALKAPNDQQSLQTIINYGTDSRYYMMIRGWLFQELVAVESQLHASKEAKIRAKFQNKSNFLKQAIRAIDLE